MVPLWIRPVFVSGGVKIKSLWGARPSVAGLLEFFMTLVVYLVLRTITDG